MRISRLCMNLPLSSGRMLDLDEAGAHYLRTVLRLTKGAELLVFNGDGYEYRAVVDEASRNRVVLHIGEARQRDVESPLQVVLGLSVSRADRMDWALQKSVELGVGHIAPLLTERCVVRLKDNRETQKAEHWQKIVQHAVEQSGRCIVPQLQPVQQLSDWLVKQRGLKIFLDPYAQTGLKHLQPENGEITLLTGPEGGFSDWERDAALSAGFIPVCLGRRILRTETAALAALAAVQTLWGDLGSPVSAAAAETVLEIN